MNTVYLFFENENIRIPFFDYDKGLFDQLIKSRMGRWENKDQQYHIARSSYESAKIKAILDGRTYVEVGKEPDNPVLVNGFFNLFVKWYNINRCKQRGMNPRLPIKL